MLTRRADFLAANHGRRFPMPGFVLLVRDRADGDAMMRIGYTVSKKVGGAVVRNRMKRRLRELVRELLPVAGIAGADHVLIGRQGGIERSFDLLRTELSKALGKAAKSIPIKSDKADEGAPLSPGQRDGRPIIVEALPFPPCAKNKDKASTSSAQTDVG